MIIGPIQILIKQPVEEKKNYVFKPSVVYLKINLVLYPACGGGVGEAIFQSKLWINVKNFQYKLF